MKSRGNKWGKSSSYLLIRPLTMLLRAARASSLLLASRVKLPASLAPFVLLTLGANPSDTTEACFRRFLIASLHFSDRFHWPRVMLYCI